ncbi:endo-1,4-beta-xylanase [Mucilaginibacter sp. P25]|uniref:Beta-xylanase n=1 Tax=Mucilaginibacter gossypii TaxID=551996 RepID=A0A1G7WFN7_9SPHI|nr:endo-1,4-beta-xylanase [Mucilaginibacter gossypii]SDG70718.1 endo-1,4-beta-xylanase [Mucilaginibacter gossypii]
MKYIALVCTAFCFVSFPSSVTNHKQFKYTLNTKTQNDTLKKATSFPIGVGIGTRQLNDPKIREIVVREFNSMSTASSLFWNQLRPTPNTFLFSPADDLVNFGVKNNLDVHGHCLIYFQGLPDWVQNFQGDSVAWENLFKTHIQTIVRHFKGRVKSWDVVNEAFDNDGTPRMATYDKKYVNVWALHLGKDYIARAFIYAHEADPQAVLFYNDNSQEKSPRRLQAMLNMVRDFKARNIPIGGLGLQLHVDIGTSQEGIKNALVQSAKTGLQIHISELDIRLNPGGNLFDTADSSQNANKQANLYYYIAHQYKTLVPKRQQFGITFWCVTDKDTYINAGGGPKKKDNPLLFDEQYRKKPSYKAFISGLEQ